MIKKPSLTSAQIRAARALLNWSARHLSQESGVSQSTIHRAESAEGCPSTHQPILAVIRSTLEKSGVDFLDYSGVRLRPHDGAEESRTGDQPTNGHGTLPERPLAG